MKGFYWGLQRNFYMKNLKGSNLQHEKMKDMKPFYISAGRVSSIEKPKPSTWKITIMASIN